MSQPSTSSGLKSSSVAISARPSRIMAIQVLADGTNAATLTVYDNASAASGTEVSKVIVDAGLTYELFYIDGGVQCNNGIYASVSGTGAAYIIFYQPTS